MSEPRLADPAWSLIWCRGEDATTFLQGLLSADLNVAAGAVRRSFLLQPNGKVTALLWLLIGEGEIGLICDTAVRDSVVGTLRRFQIRVKAELEVAKEPITLVIGSREAPSGEWRREEGRVLADASHAGVERTIVVGDAPAYAALSAEDYVAHRIRLGEPVVGRDIDESTIPQETGLVGESVSFSKGCYLGQELVARIDTRGHVNQRLMRVESPGSMEVGDRVSGDGREAVVTSAARANGGSIGLAMVRRELPDGAEVVIQTASGSIAGVVHDPVH